MDDVFKNQYLLDIILKYLTHQDELNLLKTLKIEVDYVTRELKVVKNKKQNKKHYSGPARRVNTLLLQHTKKVIKYFSRNIKKYKKIYFSRNIKKSAEQLIKKRCFFNSK